MSRGSQENERARKSIREGLFSLLRKKNFSEITVTDIAAEAGVARATYYRNYDSKESVLQDYIESLRDDIISSSDNVGGEYDPLNADKMVKGLENAFSVFLMNKPYLLALNENGFGAYIQELLDEEIENLAGDMPSSSPERYKLYFISGANNNILMQWLKNGAIESPYELAKLCVKYMKDGVLN